MPPYINEFDSVVDKELRKNIRELGFILGRVLIEQEGEKIFNVVENLRLQTTLSLRNPYIDPVSFIQVKFLKRYRSEKLNSKEKDELFSLLRSSVNGIASGLKNTG